MGRSGSHWTVYPRVGNGYQEFIICLYADWGNRSLSNNLKTKTIMKSIITLILLLSSLSSYTQDIPLHFGEDLKAINKRIYGTTNKPFRENGFLVIPATESMIINGDTVTRSYLGSMTAKSPVCNSEILWVQSEDINKLYAVLDSMGLLRVADYEYEGSGRNPDGTQYSVSARLRKTTLKKTAYEAVIKMQ